MNSIWQAYYDMFNKKDNVDEIKKTNLIMEDDQDQDDDMDDDEDQDDTDDQQDDSEDDTDDTDDSQDSDSDSNENKDDEESSEDKEQSNIKGAKLNFSADLAAQFGNTCNKFTTLAANVVKQRTVDKETAEQLKAILEKLKSLIEAAENSI